MPMLSEMTCEDLKSAIILAEQAYQDLVLGVKARVIVDKNGERVEFVSANRYDLYSWMQQLNELYNSKCGNGTCIAMSRGPTGFLF